MSTQTIPESLENDLRERLLADAPAGLESLTADPNRLRVKTALADLPAPRLVIAAGDPKRIPGMDGTARVMFTLDYTTAADDSSPQDHLVVAGAVEAWLRDLRARRRTDPLARLFLHDLLIQHPRNSNRAEIREQVTLFTVEAIVTLKA